MTFIAENDGIVKQLERHSSEDDANYAGLLDFRIMFNNGSRLIAISNLMSNGEVIEYDYYYCYRNSRNVREFSYDDRPHHEEIATHPHHMHKGAEPDGNEEDTAFASDLSPVNFFAIFQRICDRFRS